MLIVTRHLKVTRRGAFLALFGAAYLLIGYSYLSIPPVYKPLLYAQFRFALNLAPIEFYGWMWIVFGAAAIIGGLYHRLDWLGFAAGVFMPIAWALLDFAVQIEDHVPRAWVGGTTFALIGAAVWIVSAMPDPRNGNRTRHRTWTRS